MADYNESVILEGMYKGVASKIDALQQSVEKEIRFSTEQQSSSYEAIAASLVQGIETIMNELRYIAEQSSAIYDNGKKEREADRDAIVKELTARLSGLPVSEVKEESEATVMADTSALDAKLDKMTEEMNERTDTVVRAVSEQFEQLTQKMAEALDARTQKLTEEFDEKLGLFEKDLRRDLAAQLREEMRRMSYVPTNEDGTVVEEVGYSNAGSAYTIEDTFDYDTFAEKVASLLPETDYDVLADKIAAVIPQVDENALADKIAAVIPQPDEAAIADKVADSVPPTDYDLIAERVAGVMEHEFDVTVDDNGIARIAQAVAEELDYEKISEKVAEYLKASREESEAVAEARTEEVAEEEAAPAMDTDELARKVAESFDADELARRIAETLKTEEIVAAIDSDEIAEKVAALLKAEQEEEAPAEAAMQEEEKGEALSSDEVAAQVIAGLDYALIARYVAENMNTVVPVGETSEVVSSETSAAPVYEMDTDEVARKVVELLDYATMARMVAAELPQQEDGEPYNSEELVNKIFEKLDVEELARKVAEYLKEEGYLSEKEEKKETRMEEIAAAAAMLAMAKSAQPERVEERPQPESGFVSQPVYEAPAPAPAPVMAPAPAPAPQVAPAPVPVQANLSVAVTEEEEDEVEQRPRYTKAQIQAAVAGNQQEDVEMTTRYKRSFTAKIIESEEDVKEYYSELKNTFLSYARVDSQINWTNDRFAYDRETVAKIGMRGKTLCLYLALNPDEFPTTIYHQKFAGDTKMYEKTPMMVKIKSVVALKRSLKLVELLMESNQAVKEDRARVDYAAEFAFRSEEELLREGLIKTALVEKSDLDF